MAISFHVCISRVLKILPLFDSSSKIYLLKTNWVGKFTLFQPNEVTSLAALIRSIKNGTYSRLGMAISWLYLWNSLPAAGCIGQVGLIPPKKPSPLPSAYHCSPLGIELSPYKQDSRMSVYFHYQRSSLPTLQPPSLVLYSLYQLAVIFQYKSLF